MLYRKDVDGLRSFAIIPVVLYHAGFDFISGGFAGVDVFFVISGFLISKILLDEVAISGRVNIYQFYFRRAKRLLPALFFTYFLAFLFSIFLFLPEDLVVFAEQVNWSLVFLSNFYFYNNINYFGPASDYYILLHTWSLAVEEQFYLIWPFVIIVVGNLIANGNKKLSILLIFTIIIFSFLSGQYTIGIEPQSAFYLTPFRIWELALGASVALLVSQNYKWLVESPQSLHSLMYCAALGVLVWQYFTIDATNSFPGITVLPIVLSTGLILALGQSKSVVLNFLISNKVLVFIGKISYSLYLVHWVLISSYINYIDSEEFGYGTGLILISVSSIISILSYKFIEKPTRRIKSPSKMWAIVIVSVCAIISTTYYMKSSKGIPTRISKDVPQYLESRAAMQRWLNTCRYDEGKSIGIDGYHRQCTFGAKWEGSERKIVLWGDSHADHFAQIIEAGINSTTSVLMIRNCPAFLDDKIVKRLYRGSDAFSKECGVIQARALEWLKDNEKNIDLIIMPAAWSGYLNQLYKVDTDNLNNRIHASSLVIDSLKNIRREIPNSLPILLLGDIPRPNVSLASCVIGSESFLIRRRPELCAGLPRSKVDDYQGEVNFKLAKFADSNINVSYIDMVDRLCTADRCSVIYRERLLYMDGNHFRMNLNKEELKYLNTSTGLGMFLRSEEF